MFKLNRMEELKKTKEKFAPKQVPMPDLSNERIFPANIRVKALFEPDAKWRLVEEFGPHCFKEQKDGRLLFEMDYTDESSLMGWLLTFGEKARVLEPAEVREKYPWLVPVHADGVVGGKKEFTLLNKSEMELLADAYEMANIMH